jgi:hypothetical protein
LVLGIDERQIIRGHRVPVFLANVHDLPPLLHGKPQNGAEVLGPLEAVRQLPPVIVPLRLSRVQVFEDPFFLVQNPILVLKPGSDGFPDAFVIRDGVSESLKTVSSRLRAV